MASQAWSRRRFVIDTVAVAAAGAGVDVVASTAPKHKVLATGLSFPEGPVVLADGSVVATEILADKLTRVTPAGKVELFASLAQGPNGMAIGPDGALYVVTNGGPPGNTNGGVIKRLDMKTRQETTLYARVNGRLLRGPNDIVFDAWGDAWITDFAGGAVYCARIDGSVLAEVARLESANGIALSPDGRTLYVVQAFQRKVIAFTIRERGKLAQEKGAPKATVLATLSDDLDSMKVEASGNLVVASGESGLTTVSPAGKILAATPVSNLRVTNLAFGGADMRTAYVTGNLPGGTAGQLIAVPWPRPGLKLRYS